MSMLNAVNAELEARQIAALESIADSLRGLSQDVWECKEMLIELTGGLTSDQIADHGKRR